MVVPRFTTRVLGQLSKNVQHKIPIIVLSISLNMCFGCWIEPSHWDSSFEYLQHRFWVRDKKIIFSYTRLSRGLFRYYLKHRVTEEQIGCQGRSQNAKIVALIKGTLLKQAVVWRGGYRFWWPWPYFQGHSGTLNISIFGQISCLHTMLDFVGQSSCFGTLFKGVN